MADIAIGVQELEGELIGVAADVAVECECRPLLESTQRKPECQCGPYFSVFSLPSPRISFLTETLLAREIPRWQGILLLGQPPRHATVPTRPRTSEKL